MTKKLIKATNFLLIAFTVILLSSCIKNAVTIQNKSLPEEGWNKDSVISFDTDITDTTKTHQVLLTVRHNSTYRMQNLWLFIDVVTPNNTIEKDTIECFLANNEGEWLGDGFGSLYEMNILSEKAKKFHSVGKYTYQIRHGMRADILTGIQDIGIEISQNESSK